MISLLFGDVFRYKDKEYVFLVKTEDVWYVAEILNLELTKLLDNLCQKKIRANLPINDRSLYCYVILKTEEFKNRAANYGKPGKDDLSSIDKLPFSLCIEDKKQIKKEIESSKAVPLGLKERIKKISI